MADLEQIPVVKPEEAIDFFRAKGDLPSFAWQDVFQDDHAKAFTVAKAMNRDLLAVIREALDEALTEGKTLDEFRDQLRPKLEAMGWWGRATMVDPLDGQFKDVQLGSPSRLRTIYRVNMRSAYAAGKWQRIEATKQLLPYLRYVQIQRPSARDDHKPWHGLIVPVDSPWWDQHYPPCDWNCGCTTQQLNLRQIERRGWTVTEAPPTGPAKVYTNPRSGQRVAIEAGIAPGFGFNVGKAYLAGVTPRPLPGGGTAIAAELPIGADGFLSAFGLEADGEAVFIDAGGWPVPIGAGWFRDPAGRPVRLSAALLAALPDAAAAIKSPSEIRWVWRAIARGGRELARRYIGSAAGRALVVDIGGAGWSMTSAGDKGFDLASLRIGRVAWTAADS